MELLILRHAAVPGNRERRFIGVTDLPLTPEGRAQAAALSPSLPAVERVYRSPMCRCGETAALLWPEVPSTVVQQLREMDFGPFEGKNHQELRDDPRYLQWLADGVLPGVESPREAADRAAAGLALVLADMEKQQLCRAAVVTHGGTIMGLLSVYGRPARAFHDWMCPNCTGYRMTVEPGPLLRLTETIG